MRINKAFFLNLALVHTQSSTFTHCTFVHTCICVLFMYISHIRLLESVSDKKDFDNLVRDVVLIGLPSFSKPLLLLKTLSPFYLQPTLEYKYV